MLMQYSLRTLILILIGLLLFWSVMDYGGRYLHVQALAQVISGGLLLLLVLEQIRHPRMPLLNDYPLFLPACCWFGTWVVAWVFSVNRLASLEELLRLLMYLSLPAVLFVTVKREALLEKMAGVLIFTAALVCGIGWIMGGSEALGSTFNRTNDLAGYLLIVIPLALHMSLLAQTRLTRLLFAFASVLMLLSLIMTQSRSSWVACALSLGLWLFWQRKQLTGRFLPWLVGGASLFVVGGLIWKGPVLATRFQSVFSLSILQENGTAWRLELLQGALRIFKDFPITGSGPNTFATIFPAYLQQPGYFSINPHNYYLQILAETGIVGTLGLLFFLFALFRQIYKNRNPLMAGVLAGLMASLIHIAFDIDWSVTAIPIAFFYLAGLGLVMPAESVSESKTSTQPSPLWLRAGVGLIAISLMLLPTLNYFSAQAYAQAAQAMENQDLKLARLQLEKARQWAPWPSGRHHALWAELELKEKKHDLALGIVFKALSLDRYNTEYFKTAIDVLKIRQNKPQTRSLLQKRIALTPYRHPAYYTELGDFELEQKAWTAAQTAYEQGMNAFPVARLSNYEHYTPSHRYEVFRLYQHRARLAEMLKQTTKTQTLRAEAQAVIQGGSADLFLQSGLPTPVSAIQHYWRYLRQTHQRSLSEHPEAPLPLPPQDIEFDLSKIQFWDAERSIFSARLLYSLPMRKKGTQQWRLLLLQDNLQGLPNGWKIIGRTPVSAQKVL